MNAKQKGNAFERKIANDWLGEEEIEYGILKIETDD